MIKGTIFSLLFCTMAQSLRMRMDLNTKQYISKYKDFLKTENYDDLLQDIKQNKVSKLYISDTYQEVVSEHKGEENDLPEDIDFINNGRTTKINPIFVQNLIDKSTETKTSIEVVDFRPDYMINFNNGFEVLSNTISILIPIYLIATFLSFLSRNPMTNGFRNNNMKSNMMPGQLDFFNNRNNNDNENTIQHLNVTLENWAGSPEVLDECKEVISYIDNKEKYKKIGAEMPKGILLEGPPGTGKTLLAKAIASQTNSTFLTMSGSEFVELFVGMGASRVRELFQNARNNRPCIIFIDEIDAVGRQRGAGINMGNDEREQTLNQLLYEMDGFNDNDDIVVIAATNRKDVLDQALLRPGRFDRIISVPVPDKDSRSKILEFYLKKMEVEDNFDISAITELTDGFSGAELKNLINEAAILSVKNEYNKIQERFIFDAFEKLIVGIIKKNATVNDITRERVAIHESGHSLLALAFKEYFVFQKASIQPTYNGAGGYTIFTEKPEIKEGGLYTKDILKKRLVIAMGGKAAESLYYGDEFVSMGAIQDLKQANSLAKRMVGNFGMGERLEVFYNEDITDDSNPFLGRSLASQDKYSEYTRHITDKESLDLVKEAYSTAKTILNTHRDVLIEFSNQLLNNTVVYKKDVVYKM